MQGKYFQFDELLTTLSQLLEFESTNPPGNEAQICEYVYNYFKNNNINVEKIQVEKNKFDIIAHIKGKTSKDSTIFTGHMDVVPVSFEEKHKWKSDPFKPIISDGYIYGRGSSDMKSGLCCGMHLLKYLNDNNIIPEHDVYFVATYDEEDFMSGSKALSAFKKCENVIVMEPTDLKVCSASNGRTYGNIKFYGQSGHGSIRNREGNAILLAHDFISEMERVNFEDNTFWQVVSINAGVEPCVVPDYCIIKIDARLSKDFDVEEIWRKLENISSYLKMLHPKFKYEFDIIDKREGWISDKDSYVYKKLKQTYDKLNINFEEDVFPGTTDGTILRRNNREVIIVGPGSLDMAHKENERCSIDDIKKAFKIYLNYVK
ncbi:MAG: M20/M25/M40 family metallo-hydrolase [Tissierellia bacterium]|nr:M20/M25/M40 family metallo-hydrolase [Tissierellia bacterium]